MVTIEHDVLDEVLELAVRRKSTAGGKRAILKVLLLGACLSLHAATISISVVGTTETQAIIAYTATTTAACTLTATDNNGGPTVNDVDATKFTNASLDLSRTVANGYRWPSLCGGTACSGGNTAVQRIVTVGGHTEVKQGVDTKWYSTALQVNSSHTITVSCNSGSDTGSVTATTRNIPQGSNYPEIPIPQPTNPNAYPAPTINWLNRDEKYIDPVTGVLQKVLSFPLDQPIQPQLPRAVFNFAYDATGTAWTNPNNALTNQASGTLAVTSTPNAPLFLASNSGWIPNGRIGVTDEQIVLYAKGTGGTEIAEVCWSVDSGQTCDSGATLDTAALANSVSVCATCSLPSTFPTNKFSSWGVWKTGTGTYDLANQSYTGVSMSGTVVTFPARSGSTWGVNTDRVAGSAFTLTGCATGSPTNPLTVAHVDSATQITANQSFTATGCTYQEYSSGIRVTLKNSGTLSFSATYNNVQGFDTYGGQAPSRDVCNPTPITDIATDCDGVAQSPPLTGRLCQVLDAQGPARIYLVQDNGRMCLQSIGHGGGFQALTSVANPWIGAKAYMGSSGIDLWSATKTTTNYTEYVAPNTETGWTYANVTGSATPLNTQVANGPASDAKTALATGLWGSPDFAHVGLFGGNIQIAWSPGGDQAPCIRAITDSNFNIIQTYTSWAQYPFTNGGCHANAATGSVEYTNLVVAPIMNFTTGKILGGPFLLPITGIRKNGTFQNYTIPISTGTAGTPASFTSTAHDLAFYTNMTVSGGPYVTCSGATGGWTAVNGTFHATVADAPTTPTLNTFTLPVTTTGAYPGGITCVTSPQATMVNIGAVTGNLVTIATDSFGYGSYVPDGRSLFQDGDPIAISSHPTTQYYAKATGAGTNKQFLVYNDAALTDPATDVFTNADNVGLAEACPATDAAALMPGGKLYFDPGSLSGGVPKIRCLTIRVRSEPCSEWPAIGEAAAYPCATNGAFSTLKAIAVGDVVYDITASDQANHEHFLVLAKTVNSSTSIDLTVMRRYGAFDASFAADIGPAYCCGPHSMGWYLLAYPNMLDSWFRMADPTAAAFPASPLYANSHHDVGPGGGAGLVTLAENPTGFDDINALTMAAFIAVPVTQLHNNLSTWAGDANDTMRDTQKQSYPGHRQTVSGIESTWKTDATAINPDGLTSDDNLDGMYTRTVTKITGFTNVYQITNPSPSGITNIKLVPYLFSNGSSMFSEISGPADCTATPSGANCIQDANPNKFCIVFSTAGHDCIAHTTAGYAAGNIYFSSKIAPPTGSGTCFANNNLLAIPCLIPLWPLMGQYEQLRQTPIDTNGTGTRRMTAGWALPLQHFGSANWVPSSDAKWGIYVPPPVAGKGPNGTSAFAMKIPPWPAIGTINRATFVQIPDVLSGVSGDSIRIKFGYGENGDVANFWCTTRQETCWTTTAASSSNPFVFSGETQGKTACDTGCTVNIPTIPERIVFYSVCRTNGAETCGPVQVLASPIMPPTGAAVTGGKIVISGKVVVQ